MPLMNAPPFSATQLSRGFSSMFSSFHGSICESSARPLSRRMMRSMSSDASSDTISCRAIDVSIRQMSPALLTDIFRASRPAARSPSRWYRRVFA